MPIIETQGLSVNYDEATGIYETISRGEISRQEIIKILEKVTKLSVPSGENDCPPTLISETNSEPEYVGVVVGELGDSGVIHCMEPGLFGVEMTPEVAASLLCGEINIKDVEGYDPLSVEIKLTEPRHILWLIAVVFFFGAVVAAFVWPFSPIGKAMADLFEHVL
jgi:hypothetical protein